MCDWIWAILFRKKWFGKVISFEDRQQQGREELVVKDSEVGAFLVSGKSGKGHTIKMGILVYKTI